jgi:hypothetical protein
VDADGCRDVDEDGDDDGDGILDSADKCAAGLTGWLSTSVRDNDGDGCEDSQEDDDDDNDGVSDSLDAFPFNALLSVDCNGNGEADDDPDCDENMFITAVYFLVGDDPFGQDILNTIGVSIAILGLIVGIMRFLKRRRSGGGRRDDDEFDPADFKLTSMSTDSQTSSPYDED